MSSTQTHSWSGGATSDVAEELVEAARAEPSDDGYPGLLNPPDLASSVEETDPPGEGGVWVVIDDHRANFRSGTLGVFYTRTACSELG